MSRILDLDQIAPQQEEVKWNGKTYKVKPIHVDSLLVVMKSVQKLEASSKEDDDEKVLRAAEKAIGEIKAFVASKIPDLPVDDLSMPQLTSLVQWMSGVVDTGQSPKEKEAPKAEGEASKPSPSA